MTRYLILPLAAALASCTSMAADETSAPAQPPAAPTIVGTVSSAAVPADCPLTIAFGSYAMGIDNPTRARAEALLAGDRGVVGFEAHRWGREGEVTYCVRTRAAADAARLFRAVRALVPPRPRGPISLRTAGGLSFETPPPRR